MYPLAATLRGPISAPPTMTSMDMQQPCVLVVDDDPDLRKLIGEFLSAHGYQVGTLPETRRRCARALRSAARTSSYST